MCFLGVRLGKGRLNYSPSLKLIRIILEIWNLVCKYTHLCSLRKKYLKVSGPLNFAAFSFFKKVFVILKVVVNEIIDNVSRIQPGIASNWP